MRIIITNQKKTSKAIIPTQVYHSIYYHAIYQYHSIYHALSILPLHVPNGFYLNVYTIATCGQWWQLIYDFNKKLWCMLIVWHQNHWVIFLYNSLILVYITPSSLFDLPVLLDRNNFKNDNFCNLIHKDVYCLLWIDCGDKLLLIEKLDILFAISLSTTDVLHHSKFTNKW